MAPNEASPPKTAPAEEDTSQETSQKILDEGLAVRQVQEWWSDGHGPSAVQRNPILAAIDPGILAEVVSACGGYHNILSADRLDGLHRRLGNGNEQTLEPLRKALQTRGGTKAQARVVGMLLFKEARSLHVECLEGGFAPGPHSAPADVAPANNGAAAQEEVRLDEAFPSPRLYVCADSYPEGAQMALRAGPSSKSSLLATLPANTEYHATGIVGDFVQVQVQMDNTFISAYALHKIGDMVLLVAAQTAASAQPAHAGSAPTSQTNALDEAWSPPRRFVCSDTYPEGAQMAVKAGPSRESKQIATVPAGAEYIATGRCGDYLQVRIEIDGVMTTAYVPHTLGDMLLLVPAEVEAPPTPAPAARAAAAAVAAAEAANAAAAAEAATGDRVFMLEKKVAGQEQHIQALQAEMAQMRAQLSAVAAAFRPLGC